MKVKVTKSSDANGIILRVQRSYFFGLIKRINYYRRYIIEGRIVWLKEPDYEYVVGKLSWQLDVWLDELNDTRRYTEHIKEKKNDVLAKQ